MNLNFHGENTTVGPHGLHAFGAKLPPQLTRWAIEQYSLPGDLVCDPMAGSGTTLVEAITLGRRAVGCDLDPLACLIAAAKATPLDIEALAECNMRLNLRLMRRRRVPGSRARQWQRVTLPSKERWFSGAVVSDLCAIKDAIAGTEAPAPVRRLWHAVFSSLITAKHSVANARDIVHSRHHYKEHLAQPDARARFLQRLAQAERRLRHYDNSAVLPLRAAAMLCADARRLPIRASSVDLIVTSPPYCNALDYTRAHRFSVAWLERELGVTLGEYTIRGRSYIGSERGARSGREPAPVGIAEVDAVAGRIAAHDPARGRLAMRYVEDMQQVISEAARVLRPGGTIVLVICPSNIRQIIVDWHEVFIRLGANLPAGRRLEKTAVFERAIDDSRRILPYMNAGAQLGARMRREFVLVLRKEEARNAES